MKKLFFALLMLFVSVSAANAEVKVNVTQGSVEPLPVAITTC